VIVDTTQLFFASLVNFVVIPVLGTIYRLANRPQKIKE
jgi:hypothetical protein